MNNIGKVIGNVKGVDVLVGSTWRCKDGTTGVILENYAENRSDYPIRLDLTHSGWRTMRFCGFYYGALDPCSYDLYTLVSNPAQITTEVQEMGYTEAQIRQAWEEQGFNPEVISWESFISDLKKSANPEYQKYLELKAKFESK